MITRLELCEHWEPWDDCYECGQNYYFNTGLKGFLAPCEENGTTFIYLASPTADGRTATEWADHVE